MCGIITVVRKDNKSANKMVAKRYQAQKTRGREGFGYLTLKASVNKIDNIVRSTTEDGILKALEVEKSSLIMFHHRYPTSTPNFEESTHPIVVDSKMLKYNYYVIHNGIIHNDNEIKAVHDKQGFDYVTSIRKEWITKGKTYFSEMYNDSETLAIDLALVLDGKQEEITVRGSIAFVCLQTKKNGELVALHYGRNTNSPLKVDINENFISISSEGQGDVAKVNTLYTIDANSYAITTKALRLGEDEKTTAGFTMWSETTIPKTSIYDDYGYNSLYDNEDDEKEGKRLDAIEQELDALEDERRQTERLIKKAQQEGDEEQESFLYGELGEINYKIYKLENQILC